MTISISYPDLVVPQLPHEEVPAQRAWTTTVPIWMRGTVLL